MNGKTVSRSVYQKLAEENKRLIADLKVLCIDDKSINTIIVGMKLTKHFQSEADFNSIMKEVATNYIAEHPEYDITKRLQK